MILITLVIAAISLYEWHYMRQRKRQKRTFWIAGCFMAAAYLYLSAVCCFKDLPSPNRLIEYAMRPVLNIYRH